jgi:hypothetical protein
VCMLVLETRISEYILLSRAPPSRYQYNTRFPFNRHTHILTCEEGFPYASVFMKMGVLFFGNFNFKSLKCWSFPYEYIIT